MFFFQIETYPDLKSFLSSHRIQEINLHFQENMARNIIRVTYTVKNFQRQVFENSVLYKCEPSKSNRVAYQGRTFKNVQIKIHSIFQKWNSEKIYTQFEKDDVECLIKATKEHVSKIDMKQRNYDALMCSFQEKCSKKFGQTKVMRIKSAFLRNLKKLDKFSVNLYS